MRQESLSLGLLLLLLLLHFPGCDARAPAPPLPKAPDDIAEFAPQRDQEILVGDYIVHEGDFPGDVFPLRGR